MTYGCSFCVVHFGGATVIEPSLPIVAVIESLSSFAGCGFASSAAVGHFYVLSIVLSTSR